MLLCHCCLIFFRAKNLAYEELCKIREGNDKYTERGMQTFNNALKNKDIQAEKVTPVSFLPLKKGYSEKQVAYWISRT